MGARTPKLDLYKPDAGETDWAEDVNGNWEALDECVVVAPAAPDPEDLENGQVVMFIDEGNSELVFCAKDSQGTFLKGAAGLVAPPEE